MIANSRKLLPYDRPPVRVRPKPAPVVADTSMTGTDWRAWLHARFPAYVAADFAERHIAFWEWVWNITADARPQPFVGIWPRGSGKSTSAELACVALGVRSIRRYAWYVCETQDQADAHVATIATLLEGIGVQRAVNKYGASKGWRRNRLRCANGFTIDALGLDVAARGGKLDDQRPDLMILDDLDSEQDTAATVEKKIATLTKKLLPAGAANLAVLAVQNLVHPESIFSRLADGRADFLNDRIISGPHPALIDLAYEQQNGRYILVSGTPTWEGQSLLICQSFVDTWGLSAFLGECQNEVEAPAGGMFSHLDFRHCTWSEVPDLVRIVVWCDPAVTDTDQSDAHGIQADGLAPDNTIYRLWSWEARTSPQDVLRRALRKAVELKAQSVGVETDQGGDTWMSVYREAWQSLKDDGSILEGTPMPVFKAAKAGAGHGSKTHRASHMLADYERGRIVHVLGTHAMLEKALRRFPAKKPYDLTDASYWSWYDLAGRGGGGLFQ